jgi:hypothetical protein
MGTLNLHSTARGPKSDCIIHVCRTNGIQLPNRARDYDCGRREGDAGCAGGNLRHTSVPAHVLGDD